MDHDRECVASAPDPGYRPPVLWASVIGCARAAARLAMPGGVAA
jgi:hypothetical protein